MNSCEHDFRIRPNVSQKTKIACKLQAKKVHPAGFEPATLGSEGRCSIQLSHGRILVFRRRNQRFLSEYCDELASPDFQILQGF